MGNCQVFWEKSSCVGPQVVLSGHCGNQVTSSDIFNVVVTRYQCGHYAFSQK
jgi:hypothetical protein